MTNFIIKITAITSLFILMCSFADNSVKLTSENQPCYNELEFANFTLVDQGPSMCKTKELITHENLFKKEYKVLTATFAKIYKNQSYLDMPEENSYYKTDYSFVHSDTGKNIHVNSRKENNIIFL